MKPILQAIRLFGLLTVITGVIYPLLVTAGASLFCSRTVLNGSLMDRNGQPVGSALLAQPFKSPRYFQPRPSASDFATVPSGASNFGPTSATLKTDIAKRRALLGTGAPEELLTTSGSGLDPHISPEAARYQLTRVATARNLPPARIAELIRETTELPQWGVFGKPRVNVLSLNLRLDALK